MELQEVRTAPEPDGTTKIDLHTNQGIIWCRYHPAQMGDAAVVWVFGAGGGWNGPAGGLYPRLAAQLVPEGVSSLEVAYRHPGDLEESILDARMAIAWLQTEKRERSIIVGHSFGGAVAIATAVAEQNVVAVAALSTQSYGANGVTHLRKKPILFLHGQADEILPDECSRSLFARVKGPKTIHLYPGCLHGLDQCREEVDRDLLQWLRSVL